MEELLTIAYEYLINLQQSKGLSQLTYDIISASLTEENCNIILEYIKTNPNVSLEVAVTTFIDRMVEEFSKPEIDIPFSVTESEGDSDSGESDSKETPKPVKYWTTYRIIQYVVLIGGIVVIVGKALVDFLS